MTIFKILASVALYFGSTSWASNVKYDGFEFGDIEFPHIPREFSFFPEIKWDGFCPEKAPKCPPKFQGNPPLIMISLDGFRSDYLARNLTPTIKNLAKCGTKAPFMYPVFPSKTFPNHYSQVTGLYPASHGILDNEMYSENGTLFKVGKTNVLEPFWYQKEAIWVTAEKQGKKAACLYWPGSEVIYNGILPTYHEKYSGRMPFEERIDQILRWLDKSPAARPNFINLHFNEPDISGHYFCPDSQQVNGALKRVDSMIARLILGLQWRNLVGCVNIIISSDHGMSTVKCNQSVNIEDFVSTKNFDYILGSIGRLRPKDNQTKIEDVVSALQCQNEHMRAYAKEQLPVRMHFADNHRIEPVFIDMDTRWTAVNNKLKTEGVICAGGTHGYDNLQPDMRAIFIAHGPSFKENYTAEPFINTELYEMLCELIGITPNPNNGTRGSLHHILTAPRLLPPQVEPDPPKAAEVPGDEMERKFRVYAAYCSRSKLNETMELQNILSKEKQNLHMPFGIPFNDEDNTTLQLLYHENYISAFDVKYRLPMWTSFTIMGEQNVSELNDVSWMGDARISAFDTARCSDYSSKPVKRLSILQRPLYPPEFSETSVQEQATYVTNSIPKSLQHTYMLEKEFNQLLSQKVAQKGQLNVVMGPAFDFEATGIRPHIGVIMRSHAKTGPIVVPTHIFAVTTWCSTKTNDLKHCDASKLETLAYLLPNLPYPDNCESGRTVIERNVARVVDVEKLTGISFYTGLPTYDAIRLRTKMPLSQLMDQD